MRRIDKLGALRRAIRRNDYEKVIRLATQLKEADRRQTATPAQAFRRVKYHYDCDREAPNVQNE